MSRPAKPKAEPKVRMILVVAGVTYTARSVDPPDGYRRAWRLTRTDPKLGKVPHVIAASAAGSATCDCEAQRFHPPCKHVRAGIAIGLL